MLIGGQQKPAIRVQVDPAKLQTRGLALEDVRGVIANATTQAAKGLIQDQHRASRSSQRSDVKAEEYNDVIIAYRNGAPVRIRDIGHAVAGPEDITIAALCRHQARGDAAGVFKQPGANVISTVDRSRRRCPASTDHPDGVKSTASSTAR